MRARTVLTALACAVLLVVLALPAVFVNSMVGYLAPIALLVVLLLCLAYLVIVKRSLSFEERGPDDGAVRGEVLKFALAVRNGSFLPVVRVEALFSVSDLFGGEGKTDVRLVTLPPRSDKVFDLGVRFDHIGTYQVGIRQVTLFDPLGVFYSLRDSGELHTVVVEPRVVDISTFELSDRSLQESSKNIKTFINDGMDYSSVRDYHWGDPMKSIHWKLSSKKVASYFTRLYETPTAPGVALFMDLECPDYDVETMMCVNDAVVESAVSIERYCATVGYDTELFFVDGAGSEQRVTGPLDKRYVELMDRVPDISAGDGAALLGLVRRVSSSIHCQNNLIVCSASVTDALIDTLIALSSPTRFPFLVAIIPSEAEGADARRASLKRLGQARIPYMVVRQADDLTGGGE